MLEETANVVNANDEFVWLQVDKQSACGKCNANKGCGTSILAKYFNRHPAQIKLPNTHNAKTGDQVIIGLSEQAILKGSMLVYLLPVLTMLAGAIIGNLLAGDELDTAEIYSIIFGVAGLLIGSFWSKRIFANAHNIKNYQPELLRVL